MVVQLREIELERDELKARAEEDEAYVQVHPIIEEILSMLMSVSSPSGGSPL